MRTMLRLDSTPRHADGTVRDWFTAHTVGTPDDCRAGMRLQHPLGLGVGAAVYALERELRSVDRWTDIVVLASPSYQFKLWLDGRLYVCESLHDQDSETDWLWKDGVPESPPAELFDKLAARIQRTTLTRWLHVMDFREVDHGRPPSGRCAVPDSALSERVTVRFTPTQLMRLERLRGAVPMGTFIRDVMAVYGDIPTGDAPPPC